MRRGWLLKLIRASCVALPGSAAHAQTLPFEGKWATAIEKCGNTTNISPMRPGVPIELTAKRLVAAPFMTCDFESVLPGGVSFRAVPVGGPGRQDGRFLRRHDGRARGRRRRIA